MTDTSTPNPPLSAVEGIKTTSKGLRGTLKESVSNQLTGQLFQDDQQLIKFHGMYQQDDRDRRFEREEKKLEWAYSYMVRLRIAGGDITAPQWLGIERIANAYGTGTVKITTRQTVQIHGVVKAGIKPTLAGFRELGLDSIAACGDVNRNVMAGAFPSLTKAHDEIFAFGSKISEYLLPKTKAFTEVWVDDVKVSEDQETEEHDPLYQDRYLPRKFKIGLAIPPHNEGDIYSQDIGLVAIINDQDEFTGVNVFVGGGMGATHGNPHTYPRTGSSLGYVDREKVLDTVWQIVAVQRDYGNRSDRKLSRLKYTVDKHGVDWFRLETERRLGFNFEAEKPFTFTHRTDLYDWTQDHKGQWYYGLFVENGLVVDKQDENGRIKSALLALAKEELCHFRFTGNQNIMLTYISDENKPRVQAILAQHGVSDRSISKVRGNAMACVALPTCPLAMAEAQRYLPSFITKVESLLEKHLLSEKEIHIRMTGCPNGCARPYLAEVGLVGKSAGKYNVHIGGDHLGSRLNTLWKEEQDEGQILEHLEMLFTDYKQNANQNEPFGDYCHRAYIAVYT